METQSDHSMMESILYELRVLLLEVTEMDIDPNLVDLDEALLDGNLGMDSAEILTYVQEVEERFGFEFDDDDLNPEVLSSLRSLADFVLGATSSRSIARHEIAIETHLGAQTPLRSEMRRKRDIGACRFSSNEHSECIASGHPCIASGHSP